MCFEDEYWCRVAMDGQTSHARLAEMIPVFAVHRAIWCSVWTATDLDFHQIMQVRVQSNRLNLLNRRSWGKVRSRLWLMNCLLAFGTIATVVVVLRSWRLSVAFSLQHKSLMPRSVCCRNSTVIWICTASSCSITQLRLFVLCKEWRAPPECTAGGGAWQAAAARFAQKKTELIRTIFGLQCSF